MLGRELKHLMQLDEAINAVASSIRVELGEEVLPIVESVGRFVAEDIIAGVDLPYRDRSAVDGYAVRAEDTYGASEYNPIVLRVVGEVEPFRAEQVLGPGEAVKIYTGMPLPSGSNAVIMLEDVVEDGDKIYIMRSVSKYANVALHGEDIKRGRTIIQRGSLIEPKHIAALAALGIDRIKVYEKLSVCVICIGDEIIEPGSMEAEEALSKGFTFNSSAVVILSYMKSLRFVDPIYIGLVGDSPSEIKRLLLEALDRCHVVVTTGGVGPSKRDVTIDAVESIGGNLIVRGLAIRPGRPTSVAVIRGKPVFMLSGYPVAAFLGFRFFVMPSLEKAISISIPKKAVVARLRKRVANIAGYTSFVRVKLYNCGDILCAEPVASMGSGTISTILDSDGILVVPSNLEGFDENQLVPVQFL